MLARDQARHSECRRGDHARRADRYVHLLENLKLDEMAAKRAYQFCVDHGAAEARHRLDGAPIAVG